MSSNSSTGRFIKSEVVVEIPFVGLVAVPQQASQSLPKLQKPQKKASNVSKSLKKSLKRLQESFKHLVNP
jgi:hypothetical protein